MNAEIWLRVGTLSIGLVSAAATAGTVYGLIRAALKHLATGQRETRQDVREIREALGLVPVDGRIRAAFPTHDECKLREDRSDRRLAEAESKLDDHERRLTAVEVRQEG